MGRTVTIDVRSKKVINKRQSSGSTVAKKGKGQSGQLFSGKVLGIQVPGAKGVLQNKTLQKILVGAGAVSVGLAVVQLINNPTLNKWAAKKEVRILAAGVGGDIPGAAFQFLKEDGTKLFNKRGTTTNGSMQMAQVEGFA